jgi:hypothetical protein
MTAAANKMFVFYTNMVPVKAKYGWNKIVEEQTEGNPCVDLQGVLQKGPRGMSRQLFDDCVLFHLLTVFPIKATEQEKYYITNVCKKPKRVSVRQFVWCVDLHSVDAVLLQQPQLQRHHQAGERSVHRG